MKRNNPVHYSEQHILTRKRYTRSVAVNGRSPEALVKGWNDGLSDIIGALVADLRATQF